nr:hypothetical protein Itr_chr06CG14570 [Ipomoea trifida]
MAPTSATHRATLKKFLVCQPRLPRGGGHYSEAKKKRTKEASCGSAKVMVHDAMMPWLVEMLQNNLQSLVSVKSQSCPKLTAFS